MGKGNFQSTYLEDKCLLQVLNKIDLPGAEPSRVSQEIEEVGAHIKEKYLYSCLFVGCGHLRGHECMKAYYNCFSHL